MAPPTQFRVSVVIPVYHAERYVARAVESALAQPETAEVLLVEDGSPDNSLAVCERLASRHPGKVRLLRHPDGANRGAGPSRNLGIREARHPFIAFLDADDTYLPGRFVRDAELLLADETLDGVHHALGVEFLDEEGRRWWGTDGSRPELTAVRTAPPPERLFFDMQPIGTQGWFHLDALTLRRSALDKAEWFSNLRLSQDTLFAVQLAATCRTASGQTGTPVALRGVHGSNRIQDPARMRAARRTVYLRLLAWARRRRLPPDQRRAIQRLNLSGLERPGQWLRVFWTDPQTLLHSRVRDVLRRTWNRIFRRSAVR